MDCMTHDEGCVYLWAMRYSFGRMTAAPDVVCEQIKLKVKQLPTSVLMVIAKEIWEASSIDREARKRDENAPVLLGGGSMTVAWQNLALEIENELRIRVKTGGKTK